MIDHIGIHAADFDKSEAYYDAVFATFAFDPDGNNGGSLCYAPA